MMAVETSSQDGAAMGPPSTRSSFTDVQVNSSKFADQTQQPTKRKRRRRILACLECHRRRVKCDFGVPCKACIRHGVQNACAYASLPCETDEAIGDTKDGVDTPVKKSISDAGSAVGANQSPYSSASSSSAQRSSNAGDGGRHASSISPPSGSEEASIGTHHRPVSAPLTLFLRGAQGEAPPQFAPVIAPVPPIDTSKEVKWDEDRKPLSMYARRDAEVLRTACADWPEADRLPSVIKFFLDEVNGLLIMMERDDVNTSTRRRVMPLIESRHSAESFYNRLRPGDATKLAMVATMVVNSAMRCSLGLLATWFTDRAPGQKIDIASYTAASRDTLTRKLQRNVKTLLEECIRLDPPAHGQVRAIIAYIDMLKGAGTLAGPEALMWFPRLSQAVQGCQLHREPPKGVGNADRETHRRLFVSFVATNWYGATIYGEHLRFPADRMDTTFPQVLVNPEHECLMLRFRMGKLFGAISRVTRNGPSDWRAIDDIEDDLSDTIRSYPVHLRPSMSVNERALLYTDDDGPTMMLQKHLLTTFYHFLRGLIHRLRFFQHPDIPAERVEHSRAACVESAQCILWLQQEYRASCFSDAWLRGFHFVYFTLEPTVILVLAALTTLGDAEVYETTSQSDTFATWAEGGRLKQAMAKARSYIAWSQRGADLMATLPMDVTTNVLAAQFIDRLISKATSLLDWYDTYARSTNGPRLPIFSAASATKHVLSDNDGRPLEIPLFDAPLRALHFEDLHLNCRSNPRPRQAGIPTAPMRGHQPAAPAFETTKTDIVQPQAHSVVHIGEPSAMTAAAAPPGLMMDFGMGGFESLQFVQPSQNDSDIVAMFETAPPLEEQMDAWLAMLLQ